jgi:hypothetical protein
MKKYFNSVKVFTLIISVFFQHALFNSGQLYAKDSKENIETLNSFGGSKKFHKNRLRNSLLILSISALTVAIAKNCFSSIKQKMGFSCIPSSLATSIAASALITGQVMQFLKYREFIKNKSDAVALLEVGEFEITRGDEKYAEFCSRFSTYKEYGELIKGVSKKNGERELLSFVESDSSLREVLPETATAIRIANRCDQFKGLRNQLEIVNKLTESLRVERKFLIAAEVAWAIGSSIELGFYYKKTKNDLEAEGANLTFKEKLKVFFNEISIVPPKIKSQLQACRVSIGDCIGKTEIYESEEKVFLKTKVSNPLPAKNPAIAGLCNKRAAGFFKRAGSVPRCAKSLGGCGKVMELLKTQYPKVIKRLEVSKNGIWEVFVKLSGKFSKKESQQRCSTSEVGTKLIDLVADKAKSVVVQSVGMVPTNIIAKQAAEKYIADRATEKVVATGKKLKGKGCELACLGTTASAEESLTHNAKTNKWFSGLLINDVQAGGFLEKAFKKHPWLEPVLMLSSFGIGTGLGMIKSVSAIAGRFHYSAPKRVTYMGSVGTIVSMGLAFNLRASKMLKKEKKALESILKVVDEQAEASTETTMLEKYREKNLPFSNIISQSISHHMSAPQKMDPLASLCLSPRGCTGRGSVVNLSSYKILGVPALNEISRLGNLLDGQQNYRKNKGKILHALDGLISKRHIVMSYVKTYQKRVNQNLERQQIASIDFEGAKRKGVELLLESMNELGIPMFESEQEKKSYLASLSNTGQSQKPFISNNSLPTTNKHTSPTFKQELVINDEKLHEYEVKVDDIIKSKNADIFKIISNRYLSSGLRLLDIK